MRILAFSDVHRDDRQARALAERSGEVDVVVAAGDFASMHVGLEKLIDMLVVIETRPCSSPATTRRTRLSARRAAGGRPRRLGSEAILSTIEEKQPRLVVCGHIHEAAGQEAMVGASRVLNAGPEGTIVEL